jgi:hypothetical protein
MFPDDLASPILLKVSYPRQAEKCGEARTAAQCARRQVRRKRAFRKGRQRVGSAEAAEVLSSNGRVAWVILDGNRTRRHRFWLASAVREGQEEPGGGGCKDDERRQPHGTSVAVDHKRKYL